MKIEPLSVKLKLCIMRKALFLVIGILFICSMFAYGQKDTIIKKTEVNKQELSNTNKTPFEKNAFESWNIILIVAVQTFAVIATFIGLRVGRKNIEKQIKSTEANLIKKNYLDSTMRLVDAIANIVNECSQAKDNTGITNKKPCSDIHLINEMKCIMLLNKTDTIENDFYNCITKYRNAGVSIIDDWIKEIEEESYHVINNRLNNN